MRIFARLVGAKLRILLNTYRKQPGGWRRLLLFSVLGALFAGGIWAASHWFFSACLEIEPIGEIVVRRVLGMTLLTIFSLLCFSNLVNAFSTLYLARDLHLLVPKPISATSLYSARFAETSAHSSWMVLPFSLPIFLTAGILFHAEPSYYLVLAAVIVALAVIPTSLGIAVSLVLTSVLSAQRARHILVVAGAIAVGILVFVLRSIEPERFMNPDQRAPLLEALEALQGADASWLPSTWAIDALWPHLGYGANTDGHPVLMLLATAAMSFFVCGWLFEALHGMAFSRAQEGLGTHTDQTRQSVHSSVALRYRRPQTRLQLAPSLRKKDRLVFIRDTSQWSQLLLLAAIVAIYILNFKYIRAVTGSGLMSEMGLHFLNLALTGFVTLALTVRFVFPAVSLEGPAFWLVRSSPNPVRSFLDAKAGSWALPMVLFANLLMVTTHMFLRTTPSLQLASLLTVTPLALGFVRLGIGLGARHPRFDSDNAAEIATGVGGVLFMLIGASLLVSVVISSVAPTILFVRMIERGSHFHASRVAVAGGCAFLVAAIPLMAGRIALALGARHLESGE